MTEHLSKRLLRLYLGSLLFIAASYILGASYLGLNGHMVWRQADVYSHILGFQGKQGLRPFDSFFGLTSPYDFPIYTWSIAKLASFLNSDPLVVTRNINFLLFLALAVTGYRLARRLFGLAAGVIFVSLLCTSRLVLHYFSAPLPDLLALTLSLWGFAVILTEAAAARAACAVVALTIAALIKSPVAFPFIVCLIGMALLSRRPPNELPEHFRHHVVIASAITFVAALASEAWRSHITGLSLGLVNGAEWYFGKLELRFSPEFRAIFVDRFDSWGPPTLPYLLLLASGFSLWRRMTQAQQHLLICLAVSFLLPWLVFARLYFIHDYYQLPVVIILSLLLAATGGALFKRFAENSRLAPWIAAGLAAAFLLNQSFLLLVSPFSTRARVTGWTAMELLIPAGERVLVAGEYTLNTPVAGGLLGHRTTTIESGQLESACESYLREYKAIVSVAISDCLIRHKAEATAYFESSDGSLWLRQ